MSPARTQVGIVAWAARARGARALEMRLADTIGGWVGAVADPQAQAVLARHATHHAFHAQLWDGVVPVLHDVVVSDDPAVDADLAAVVVALGDRDDVAAGLRAAFADALPALVAVYQHWAASTSVVADRPVMRVLDLVLRDEEFDLHEGEAMLRALAF
jgi:hypothetical protein